MDARLLSAPRTVQNTWGEPSCRLPRSHLRSAEWRPDHSRTLWRLAATPFVNYVDAKPVYPTRLFRARRTGRSKPIARGTQRGSVQQSLNMTKETAIGGAHG